MRKSCAKKYGLVCVVNSMILCFPISTFHPLKFNHILRNHFFISSGTVFNFLMAYGMTHKVVEACASEIQLNEIGQFMLELSQDSHTCHDGLKMGAKSCSSTFSPLS